MKIMNKILSISLAFLISVSTVSIPIGAEAVTSDEAAAIERFKCAWQNLKGEEQSEIIAVPDIAKDFTKATTEAIATEMGTTIDKVGPYYAEFTVSSGNNGFNYKTIDGNLGLKSLYKYDRIEFYIDRTDSNNESSLQLTAYNNSNWNDYFKILVHNGQVVIRSDSSEFTRLFTEEGFRAQYLNLSCFVNGQSFRAGSVIGFYGNKVALPNNSAALSAAEWIVEASKIDLSNYQNTDEFISALNELKKYSSDAAHIYDISSEWRKINSSQPETENVASLNDWVSAVYEAYSADKFVSDSLMEIVNSIWAEKASGDANNDGVTNILDLIRMKKHTVGLEDSIYIYASDMYGNDGIINAFDISKLKKALLSEADYSEHLKNLVVSSFEMNHMDFSLETWKSFYEKIENARKYVDNIHLYSQEDIILAEEELLQVWGKLKAFDRTMFLEFSDYYQDEPDMKVSYTPQEYTSMTSNILEDISFYNGVDSAVRLIFPENRFGMISHTGKKLSSLYGKEYLELYIRTDENFNYSADGNSGLCLQLSNGNHLWQYVIQLPEKDKGRLVRVLIPLSQGDVYLNGEALDQKLNEMVFDSKMPLKTIQFFLSNCYGEIEVSSIAYVELNDVEAGVVPVIPEIKKVVSDENSELSPNPIDGIDRGDPWGYLEKAESESDDSVSEEPIIAPTKPDSNAFKFGNSLNGAKGRINNLKWVTNSNKTYEKIELETDISDIPDDVNPFKESDLDLSIKLTSSTGKTVEADAFYFEEYYFRDTDNKLIGRTEQAPDFRFRFTLTEEGTWDFDIILKIKGETVDNISGYINVIRGSDTRGFLEVEPNSKRVFRFQNGELYTPIGYNLGTYGGTNAEISAEMITDMNQGAKYNQNFARLWLCMELGFDRKGNAPSELYAGMGNAAQVDRIFEEAEKLDIYIQFVLYSYHLISTTASDAGWHLSAYNSAFEGGYLDNPSQFLTDERARADAKLYVRYILSRYGYSTNLMAFELMNEAANAGGDVTADMLFDWHKDIAQYIRANDSYNHMLTTSTGWQINHDLNYREDLWDFISLHIYNLSNAKACADQLIDFWKKYNKPVFFGETGALNAEINKVGVDKNMVYFHQINWATLMGGGAGPAAHWFWEDIREVYAYWDYTILSEMAGLIPFEDTAMKNITTEDVWVTNNKVDVLGYKGKNYAYLWLTDKNYNYSNEVVSNFDSVGIGIGINSGQYTVRYIDTWTGKSLAESKVSAYLGTIYIQTPKWNRDIAVTITKY